LDESQEQVNAKVIPITVALSFTPVACFSERVKGSLLANYRIAAMPDTVVFNAEF